jgi:quercetin dioxygenase-like cupin family protein
MNGAPMAERGQDKPAVSMITPGEGETIRLGTTRMRVLEDGRNTSHRLALAESVLAPHTPGPPQHRHAQHDEGFYVVSGTIRFTVGHEVHDAVAGTFVLVPPGAPRTFENPTDENAVMLSTFTPDLYVPYFRDLEEQFTAGRAPTPQAHLETMGPYATTPAVEFGPAGRPRP